MKIVQPAHKQLKGPGVLEFGIRFLWLYNKSTLLLCRHGITPNYKTESQKPVEQSYFAQVHKPRVTKQSVFRYNRIQSPRPALTRGQEVSDPSWKGLIRSPKMSEFWLNCTCLAAKHVAQSCNMALYLGHFLFFKPIKSYPVTGNFD